MFDLIVIGHITFDVNRIGRHIHRLPGGTAYYLPVAFKALGGSVAVCTKLAARDKHLLADLTNASIPVFLRPADTTTVFENIYAFASAQRLQKAPALAPPFGREDLPDDTARWYHLGPLSPNDFPLEIIRLLAAQGQVSLDAQGFLRKIDHGRIVPSPWQQKEEALAHIHTLKVNEAEARMLSNDAAPLEAAERLAGCGVKEVVITCGRRGALVWAGGRAHTIPACRVRSVVDTTGCGDTFMAGYLFRRLQGADVFSAGCFAANLAALKSRQAGPFQGSHEDVQMRLAQADICKPSKDQP